MRSVYSLVLVSSLAACQTGIVPPEQKAAAPAAPRVPATPMLLVAAPPPAADDVAAPPWSLTATDGSGLELVRVDAKAVVQGPLALTELHLYFICRAGFAFVIW